MPVCIIHVFLYRNTCLCISTYVCRHLTVIGRRGKGE